MPAPYSKFSSLWVPLPFCHLLWLLKNSAILATCLLILVLFSLFVIFATISFLFLSYSSPTALLLSWPSLFCWSCAVSTLPVAPGCVLPHISNQTVFLTTPKSSHILIFIQDHILDLPVLGSCQNAYVRLWKGLWWASRRCGGMVLLEEIVSMPEQTTEACWTHRLGTRW